MSLMKRISQHRSSVRSPYLIAGAIAVTVAALWLLYAWLPDYRDARVVQRDRSGKEVVDRHDEPLRLLPDSKGRFLIWCSIVNW